MKVTCKYEQDSNILTLYFPEDFTLPDGSVTTVKLADNAVTNPKIADDAVHSSHIVANAIENAHLKDALVTTAKLANLAVDADKLADLAITAGKLATGSVETEKIANDAITSAKIANLAVGAAAIAALAVGEAKIADLAVTGAKIANATILGGNIAADVVQAAHIKGSDFGTLQISSGKIQINTTDALEITSAGNIKALAGSDINMYAAEGNPSNLNFYDKNDNLIGSFNTDTSLNLSPSADNQKALIFGSLYINWKMFYAYCRDIILHGYYDASNSFDFRLQALSNASLASLEVIRNGVGEAIKFDGSTLYPGVDQAIAIGKSSYAFKFYGNNIIKAWVSFEPDATILDSFNVTSITDIGQGEWTIVWDTNFADTNYCIVGGAQVPNSASRERIFNSTLDNVAVGSARIIMQDGSGGDVDSQKIYCIAVGDQ